MNIEKTRNFTMLIIAVLAVFGLGRLICEIYERNGHSQKQFIDSGGFTFKPFK